LQHAVAAFDGSVPHEAELGRVFEHDRAAKESLNGIDPIDVKRSYRFEQGFTFELNLSGVSDELRDAFVEKRGADLRSGEELST